MSEDNIEMTAIGSRNHADFMLHDHDDRCDAQACVELPTPVNLTCRWYTRPGGVST